MGVSEVDTLLSCSRGRQKSTQLFLEKAALRPVDTKSPPVCCVCSWMGWSGVCRELGGDEALSNRVSLGS